jgi:hypothetical protein
MNAQTLERKAAEYAEQNSRVTDATQRKIIQTNLMHAYLQGLKDGIEYAKAEAKVVANG